MRRRQLVPPVLALLLVGAALLSLGCGSARLSLSALKAGLLGQAGYETERVILLSLRLPRMLAGLIAGVGLALSGVILQSVMGNPLASPNIIGVNAGAGLATVLCLSLLPGAIHFLPFAAFLGAFLTALLILGLARSAGRSRSTVVLAGVACTTVFQAMISFLAALDSDVLSSYSAFSIGGFAGVQMDRLVLPAILVALCLIAALCLSGRIEALTLGDSMAASLGVRVQPMRAACLMIASMSAAAVVSYAGLLGFVGLVVPHIARKLVGDSLRKQLIAAPLAGAVLVMLSDLAGRTLFTPSEISVGIVMAFIGAPFFFILLLRGREHPDA